MKKYKPLTREQIIISLDRLTRFKPTKEKYLRVFSDIILSNIIEPKYKRSDFDNLSCDLIRDVATELINKSLNAINPQNILDSDFSINQKLINYENSVFINDEDTNLLLENKINYKSAIKILPEEIPINLKWLKSLENTTDLVQNRIESDLLYPLELIIIAEGITEEILLPVFAKIADFSFEKYGIKIISAGGKNQVVKLYYSLSQLTRLPIFVLLDNDAKENLEQIKPKLRPTDKIHLVKSGEFEDLLPLELILKSLNSELKNFSTVDKSDFNAPTVVKSLEQIYKEKGLHEFKKAEFAHLVAKNIESKKHLSAEILQILQELKELEHSQYTF